MMKRWSTLDKNPYWKLHVYASHPAPSSEYMNFPVSIAANGKLDVMIEDCFVSEYYDYGERWSPFLLAYFLHQMSRSLHLFV